MERRPQTEPASARLYTREELRSRCTRDDAVIVIHDRVYDVTTLLAEHPGGEKVLLEQAGQDATQPFEYTNHSSDALSLMDAYKIGKLVEADRVADSAVECCADAGAGQDQSNDWSSHITLVFLCVAAFIIYQSLVQ